MKKPLHLKILFVVFLLGSLTWMSSCSDDSESDPQSTELDFEGEYALTSAQLVNSGTAVDSLIVSLLLADSPCDSSNANDIALIQLVNGASASEGTVNIVCTIATTTQAQGNWTYVDGQSLQLNINVPLSPVPFPLTLANLQIVFEQTTGQVQSIQGQVDLSAIPTLNLSEPVQIVFTRN